MRPAPAALLFAAMGAAALLAEHWVSVAVIDAVLLGGEKELVVAVGPVVIDPVLIDPVLIDPVLIDPVARPSVEHPAPHHDVAGHDLHDGAVGAR